MADSVNLITSLCVRLLLSSVFNFLATPWTPVASQASSVHGILQKEYFGVGCWAFQCNSVYTSIPIFIHHLPFYPLSSSNGHPIGRNSVPSVPKHARLGPVVEMPLVSIRLFYSKKSCQHRKELNRCPQTNLKVGWGGGGGRFRRDGHM